jgi:catechol 2,3-dioxygenase-like lactoylglutathione lyase family enzyme
MLQNGQAYAKLPASDLDRARRFYVDILGFRPTFEGEGFARFVCAGGSSFLLFASSGTASGDHDQCGWIVDDIEAEVGELRRRGIEFEEFAGATFVDGIRADPAGRSAGSATPRGTSSISGATLCARGPDNRSWTRGGGVSLGRTPVIARPGIGRTVLG